MLSSPYAAIAASNQHTPPPRANATLEHLSQQMERILAGQTRIEEALSSSDSTKGTKSRPWCKAIKQVLTIFAEEHANDPAFVTVTREQCTSWLFPFASL